MKSTYGRELWNLTKSFGVWLPGSPMQLGDYGVITEHCFERIGALRDILPQFVPQESDHEMASINLLSEGVKELRTKGGKTVTYGVSAASGVVLSAKHLRSLAVANLPKLSTELANCSYWENSWHIVTNVVSAKQFSVFIGGKAGSEFSVKVDAGQAILPDGQIPDVTLGGRVEGECAFSLIGKSGPLFVGVHRLKFLGHGLKFAVPAPTSSLDAFLAPVVEPET